MHKVPEGWEWSGGVQCLGLGVIEELDLLYFEGDLLFGFRGSGGGLNDGEGGSEADRRGSLGIAEDVLDGLDCEVSEILGFFAEEHRAIVLSVRQGVLEGQVVATPISDGIAVDADLICGGGRARAT
jgi:hypothetical protein